MGSVIIGGARTPIGKLLGGFKDLAATDLGGYAIAAALERSGVAARNIDYVVMGQVLTAGVGQIPARQAAANANMRPQRRREVGLQALDRLWAIHQPEPGSRLAKFRAAFAKVQTDAADIGIAGDVFDEWADALRFAVDDRDDETPW